MLSSLSCPHHAVDRRQTDVFRLLRLQEMPKPPAFVYGQNRLFSKSARRLQDRTKVADRTGDSGMRHSIVGREVHRGQASQCRVVM